MREHDFLELLHGHLGLDGDAGALDDFRAGVAEHVDAEHLVVLLADYDLADSLAAFVLGDEAS